MLDHLTSEVIVPDLFYVCGPMSGYDKYNQVAFEKAADNIRSRGLFCVTPHELCPVDFNNPMSWEEAMCKDLQGALLCGAGIILLPGWASSTGALAELQIFAHVLKRKVYYLDESFELHLMSKLED